MHTPLTMPWFLPLALGAGWWGIQSARGVKRKGDLILLLSLSGAPLVVWIFAQFPFFRSQP